VAFLGSGERLGDVVRIGDGRLGFGRVPSPLQVVTQGLGAGFGDRPGKRDDRVTDR
jgi:hypothetical protein